MSIGKFHPSYEVALFISVLLGINFLCNAQKHITINWDHSINSKTDTIYYHFYNDVQMIEIIYDSHFSSNEMEHNSPRASRMNSTPRFMPYQYAVYIFRNSRGKIISVFNQKRENIDPSDFIPVESLLEKKLRFHSDPAKEERSMIHSNYPILLKSKKLPTFYAIGDVNSIPNDQFPKDFSNLTFSELLLLTSRKVGLLDTLGNIVLNTVYDNIFNYDSTTTLFMQKDGKYSLYNYHSKSISAEYDRLEKLPSSPSIYILKSNNLWGVANQYGELIIDPTHDMINHIPSENSYVLGEYLIISKNNKKGLLDINLKELFPMEFSGISIVNMDGKDFFIVSIDEKKGVYDNELTPIIPIQYEDINLSLMRDAFLVRENEKNGVFDLKGNVILPIEYDKIRLVGNTTYTVHKGNKYGIFDIFMNNIYPIELDGNLEDQTYKGKYPFYFIKKEEKVGIYNSDKYVYLSPQYDEIFFHPSYFSVKLDKKTGILNSDFSEVIPIKYRHVQLIDRDRNLYLAKTGDKAGVINSKDSVIIPFEYDFIHADYGVKTRRYVVKKNGKTGIIDSANNVILECKFDRIESTLPDKYYVMKYKKKFGVYDVSGNELVEPVYDSWDSYSVYEFVSQNGKWGVLNNDFTIAIPLKYKSKNKIPCRVINQKLSTIKCRKRFWIFGSKQWYYTDKSQKRQRAYLKP